LFHDLFVSPLNDGGVVEVAFSLLALLGQNVTMISMLSLQMAAAGYLETLLGSGLGLHFRHFTISFKGIKLLFSISFSLAFSFLPLAVSLLATKLIADG
jgi:hypothetical protein